VTLKTIFVFPNKTVAYDLKTSQILLQFTKSLLELWVKAVGYSMVTQAWKRT